MIQRNTVSVIKLNGNELNTPNKRKRSSDYISKIQVNAINKRHTLNIRYCSSKNTKKRIKKHMPGKSEQRKAGMVT
jgi:hypothetical protein